MDKISQESEPNPQTPSQEIASLLSSYGEELGFDEQTCQEIAEREFEEAFETAYSYLTQAGVDPEALLAPWMEQKE